jgi:hypothetical protein
MKSYERSSLRAKRAYKLAFFALVLALLSLLIQLIQIRAGLENYSQDFT